MSDTAEILEQAARWREAGHGRGAGDGRQHLGFVAAAGRRQARGQRRRRVCRLGVGRLRRGRGRRGGARRRSATASRASSISASPTTRPGKSASPAAARSRSLSSASNEGPLSRCGDRRRARAAARSRSRPISRPAAQLLLDGEHGRGRSGARRRGARRDARGVARRPQPTLETPQGRVFVEVFSPPRRCFVIGAVHIAQPLVQMLTLADYGVDGHRPARILRDRGALSRCRADPANGPTRRSSG